MVAPGRYHSGMLGGLLNLRSLAGICLSAAVAALMSVFLRGSPLGAALPFMFLLVVIPIAHVWGMVPGMLSGGAAGVVFAIILFPPFGSLSVQSGADQLNLVLYGIAALGVAFLSSPRRTRSILMFSKKEHVAPVTPHDGD